jgi:hypothetical protein
VLKSNASYEADEALPGAVRPLDSSYLDYISAGVGLELTIRYRNICETFSGDQIGDLVYQSGFYLAAVAFHGYSEVVSRKIPGQTNAV